MLFRRSEYEFFQYRNLFALNYFIGQDHLCCILKKDRNLICFFNILLFWPPRCLYVVISVVNSRDAIKNEEQIQSCAH